MKNAIFAMVAGIVVAGTAFGFETEVFRVDVRDGFGGRVATGVEWVGAPDGGAGQWWDTAGEEEGWQTLVSGGAEEAVCVRNEVSVEGGRLSGNASWGAEGVHLVRDDVVVGDGETLTLGAGCMVKFTPGAMLRVEEGGAVVAKGALLAEVSDDAVGGDTNLDGDGTSPSGAEWWLEDAAVGALAGVAWVGGGVIPKRTYSVGEAYGTLPVPEERGALFGGWFTAPDGGGERVAAETPVAAGTKALYAKWTPVRVEVSPAAVSLGAEGGRVEVAVSANVAWTASGGAPWAVLDGEAGEGDGALVVEVSANRAETGRTCTVRVEAADGGVFREVAISQAGMERVARPVIRPDDGTMFEGGAQRVIITCATTGAKTYYTTDGSEPDEEAIPYEGSFNVFETTTVKARAYLDGMLASGTAEARYERRRTLAEAIGQPLWQVTTDSERPWTVTDETTHDGAWAAKRGTCGNDESSRMETTVDGEGWLGFWWKVVCEDDPDGTGWDRLSFWVDGRLVDSIDGDSGWREAKVMIKGAGRHTVAWEYVKDWADENETEDCGWVDQVTWEPTASDGGVPLAWLEGLGLVGDGMSAEEAAEADADGDGFTAAQEYLAGTDPTDADSVLLAGYEMRDGDFVVTWTPNLAGERDYRVLAKRKITDETWDDVTNVGDRSEYCFFMVEVRTK